MSKPSSAKIIDVSTMSDRAWDEQALTTEEVARMTGIAVSTLVTWRCRGGGPPFMVLGRGRVVRYRRGSVATWMRERERRSTADVPPTAGSGVPVMGGSHV